MSLHPPDACNHFVVIARAQGFADVFFHFAPLGVVKAGQPIGLVGEYACQREDDQQGDVSQRQFHALVFFRFVFFSAIPSCIVQEAFASCGSLLLSGGSFRRAKIGLSVQSCGKR